jgi:thymidylate synthase
MLSFETFSEAYAPLVKMALSADRVNDARGQKSVETLGVTFQLRKPMERLTWVRGRRFSLPFCLAEALWYLSGKNDVAFIEFYAPSIANYSWNGSELVGTGYGAKIFGLGGGQIDQWANVKHLLSHEDPESKRAVLQIFDGREDLSSTNPDVSCTLGLQFLLRDDCLTCCAFMRANDFYRGIVSDVFSFTFLQEAMARELDVEVGPYFHFVGSAHIYHSDMKSAYRIEESEIIAPKSTPMPIANPVAMARSVLELEAAFRNDDFGACHENLLSSLPDYWRDIYLVFSGYISLKRDLGDPLKYWESVNDSFKSSLKRNWPNLNWQR